jgi:signal peptidase I
MEPIYRDRGFIFCWRPAFFFRDPKRHDVVLVRYAGRKVMLLKRVAALEGEWLEFRNGKLFINGKKLDEPYVHYPSNWNLKPRLIEKDAVYVLGDNRSVPVGDHYFGQTSIKRIVGAPLW